MRAMVILLLAVGVLASVACDKSSAGTPTGPGGPGGPGATGAVGTWQATKAEYVWGNVRVDAVARGSTMALTLHADGAYGLTTTDPAEPSETSGGTWSASTDVLTLRPAGMSWTIEFDMTVNATTLTLNGGHVTYDINGDDVDEECVLNATWARSGN